jgi:hypothetical protein
VLVDELGERHLPRLGGHWLYHGQRLRLGHQPSEGALRVALAASDRSPDVAEPVNRWLPEIF